MKTKEELISFIKDTFPNSIIENAMEIMEYLI